MRAVRNFLNIHIVGADEIDKSTKKKGSSKSSNSSPPSLSPQSMLDTYYDGDFESFVSDLRKFWAKDIYKNEDGGNWKSFDDIPIKEARLLIKLIKQN